jgi:hypothetical protein
MLASLGFAASADTIFASLGFQPRPGIDSVIPLIQRFEITSACQVSIEQMVDRWVRIDIQSLTSDSTCVISAELMLEDEAAPGVMTRHPFETPIASDSSATMQFRPRDTLRLRHINVIGLGFTTKESSTVESAIRGGVVSLPEHGIEGDTVLSGDDLTLDRLNGEVTEILVGDGIHTLYKGEAADPTIAGRSLRPSLVEQGFYKEEFRLIFGIGASLLSLVFAAIQVAHKK